MYSLHTTTAYQSSLISFLSAIPRERGIRNMKDILNSEIFIYVQDSGGNQVFNRTYDKTLNDILKSVRTFTIPIYSPVIFPNVSQRNTAALGPKVINDLILQSLMNGPQNRDRYGVPFVKALKKPVVTYYMMILYTPGYPYASEINRITQYMVEAGLTKFWLSHFKKKTFSGEKWRKEILNEPFGMDNVEGAFWIWISLLFWSSLCFVFELFVFYLGNNKKRMRFFAEYCDCGF